MPLPSPGHGTAPPAVGVDVGCVVVQPVGALDLGSADALHGEVRALRDAGVRRVVIDLRRLTFLDSAGLRSLLALRGDAKRDGHALELIAGPPAVQRPFVLTGTRGLFDWRAAGV